MTKERYSQTFESLGKARLLFLINILHKEIKVSNKN